MSAADMMLRKERTVLVVVDLQEKLLPAIPRRESVVQNSLLLLRLAQVLELPVILTSQYSKGLGAIVREVREAAPAAEGLDKVTFGCFGDAAFAQRLASMPQRDQLLLTGVETHICVAQTVLGALEKGYRVHVASDALGARSEANHGVGLARMERSGAVVSSTEMACYELLARSDGDAFKKMLPLLKG